MLISSEVAFPEGRERGGKLRRTITYSLLSIILFIEYFDNEFH